MPIAQFHLLIVIHLGLRIQKVDWFRQTTLVGFPTAGCLPVK